MKNDLRLIKNELIWQENKTRTKETEKAHKKLLKDNLITEIITNLDYLGHTLLYVLEHKHDIIINAIKTTIKQENESLQEDAEFFKGFDILTNKDNKETCKDFDMQNDDYNFLYDSFFTIYTKIEKEEKKKQKLKEEERKTKLNQLMYNLIDYILEETKKNGVPKNQAVLILKTFEGRNMIYKCIKEDYKNDTYTNEELKKAYDKISKDFINEYKCTTETAEEEPVKLHWVWKANIILDSINAFFKHF